jgi:nucleoside 2-deoxyribosyltransferase
MLIHKNLNKGNIYLSGSMEFAPDGQFGAVWRRECSVQLKRMGYYPLDIAALDIAYTEQHGHMLRDIDHGVPLQRKMNIRKHFVYTDLQLIEKDADALIVLLDDGVRKGAGTISECQFAYTKDIPVFIVNNLPETERISGWLFAIATKIFDSFDELYEYLNSLPSGILKKDIFGNHRGGDHYLCSLCGTPFVKGKTHYVSTVSPLYCKRCVDLVKETHETHKDRYEFFIEHLEADNE